jgi:hypothetical protein
VSFDQFDEFDVPTPPSGSKGRAAISAAHFQSLAAKSLPCGLFFLTVRDGSIKRFRVRLERGKFVPGQRTLAISRRMESDTEFEGNEWETIAIVSPNGFSVFKRWRGQWEERWAAALWAAVCNPQAAPQGYTVRTEPRCWMCMRVLELPEDLQDGLTTHCRNKLFPKPKRPRRGKSGDSGTV